MEKDFTMRNEQINMTIPNAIEIPFTKKPMYIVKLTICLDYAPLLVWCMGEFNPFFGLSG